MEWIDEIKEDRRSGAMELARKAAQGFHRWVEEWSGDALEQLQEEAHHWGRELIAAQPAMVPLRQLANRILKGLEGAGDIPCGRELASRAARDFELEMERASRQVAERVAGLLWDGQVLLTHSYSSTLLASLRQAAQMGRKLRVICTESRPLCEGQRLAERLADTGLPVTLIADGAAFQLLPRADLILVGGDALTPAGLTNKIGTYGLALAARSLGLPFYALCGREKLWPLPLPASPEEQLREAEELWPHAPSTVQVLNFYFDQTPLELLTAVVTQDGPLSPEGIRQALGEMEVHPGLIH